jgi:hypothetical protein
MELTANIHPADFEVLWEAWLETTEWCSVPMNEEGTEELDYDSLDLDNYRDEVIAFVNENDAEILLWVELDIYGYGGVGHNIPLSAGGHGTGFWDRGHGALGDHLHKASKGVGPEYLYVDEANVCRGEG